VSDTPLGVEELQKRASSQVTVSLAALIFLVMTAILLSGMGYLVRAGQTERQILVSGITQATGRSIEAVSFSGKYRVRELVQELEADNSLIEHVAVLEPDGTLLAHSDAARNGTPADALHQQTAQQVLSSAEQAMHTRQGASGNLIEVMVPYVRGYADQQLGVVCVGVYSPSLAELARESAPALGVLLLLLLVISLPGVYVVSRRTNRPIRLLAAELQGILENSPLLIAIFDQEGRFVRGSAPLQTWRQQGLGVDSLRVQCALGSQVSHSVSLRGEARQLLISRFALQSGALECIIATDITAQQQMEAERDRLLSAIELTSDAIALIEDDRVLYANHAYRSLVAGGAQAPWPLLSGGDPTLLGELQSAARGGRAWQGRSTRTHADTEQRLSIALSPVTADLQVVLVRDVSREAALEEHLHRAQRLESLGRLAGGIAHDFNNLLMVILSCAELLMLTGDLSEADHQTVKTIQTAGDRAAALVQQLLVFSRKDSYKPVNTSVSALLSDIEPLLRSVLPTSVTLALRVPSPLWDIVVDPRQLEQTILNLLINARDALPAGGDIRIAARNGTFSAGELSQGLPAGDYVLLQVADNGEGMSQSVQSRIFEPFFTTKDVGKGTGLGLATVHGIAQRSGGGVWVQSQPGVGTTFTIAFPRAPQDTERPSPSARQELMRGAETILLVEDEPDVCAITRRILESAGYRVHTAENGQVALDRFSLLVPRPDLVLTDLVMPELGGIELADALLAQQSDLPILFMSGYIDGYDLPEGTDPALISKPISMSTLLTAIRAVLDQRSP